MNGILLLDRGNHSLKAALSVSGRIARKWRIEAAPVIQGPEGGAPEPAADELLRQIIDAGRPSAAAVSSVVPGWAGRIAAYLAERGVTDVVIAGSKARLPFPLLVDEPGRVGADRISAACGAVASGMPEALIIDAGTAVTVDVLSAEGFEGGSIFPGAGLLSLALSRGTAALPHVGLEKRAGLPPGRSTEGAIEAGIFWGLVGAVNEIAARSREGSALDLPVVLTGGSAPLLSGHIEGNVTVIPDLVLLGLQLLYGLNRDAD